MTKTTVPHPGATPMTIVVKSDPDPFPIDSSLLKARINRPLTWALKD